MSQTEQPEWLQKNSCVFYKLMVDSIIQDKKLQLPSKFARKYGGEFSSIATVTSSEGRVCVVEIEKLNQNMWFCNGWHEFMKHYSIQAGYFLVFKYEGKSNFNIHIFNLAACEVKSPCNTLSDPQDLNLSDNAEETKNDNEKKAVCSCPGCPASNLYRKEDKPHKHATSEEISDLVCSVRTESECDGNVGDLFRSTKLYVPPLEPGQRRTKRIRHLGQLGSEDPGELFDVPLEHMEEEGYTNRISKKARTQTSEQKAKTVKVASMFRPENPSCTIILRPSYVYKGLLLHLPRWFARRYLDGVAGFITLLCREKEWLVRCVYINGNAKLSSGWPEFVWENNLDDGDVCVFEVLNTGNIMLKVTLFRVLEVAGSED